MRVVATYADGATRDVTREAFIESGNTEVATAARGGAMTAVRRSVCLTRFFAEAIFGMVHPFSLTTSECRFV